MVSVSRRQFLAASVAAPIAAKHPRHQLAAAIADTAPVVDTLCGGGPDLDPAPLLDAGIDAVVLDLPIFPRERAAALDALARWQARFDEPDSRLRRVLGAADLVAARREGALAVVLACQDASILGPPVDSVGDANLRALRQLHAGGLRLLQLCHNDRNGVADPHMEPVDCGLTRLGQRVVEQMGELGMIVDLSHCGDRSSAEAIQLSSGPCAITHAGCRAVLASGRNKPDALIRALADRGGLFGVFNMSVWLTDAPHASLDHVLDHVDHAVDVAGEDAVAFGSDGPAPGSAGPDDRAVAGFAAWVDRNRGRPGAERAPEHVSTPELRGVDRMTRLAEGLAGRGYGSAAIAKILGGNFQRLLADVCG